jgi:1-deoxy-D-xylulose 5-phosphate reductoisomerase
VFALKQYLKQKIKWRTIKAIKDEDLQEEEKAQETETSQQIINSKMVTQEAKLELMKLKEGEED